MFKHTEQSDRGTTVWFCRRADCPSLTVCINEHLGDSAPGYRRSPFQSLSTIEELAQRASNERFGEGR